MKTTSIEATDLTLYGEIGARAFSDLAVEDSRFKRSVIIARCNRAGWGKTKTRPTDKKSETGTGGTASSVIPSIGKAYGCLVALKRGWAYVPVRCTGRTSKGNMRGVALMDHATAKWVRAGKEIVILAKDVLCEERGW